MASEISGASVSIWNEQLTDCEEGIKLDALWLILDKYLKPNEDEPKDSWSFVTKYYPDYDHSDEIGWEGDLHKLVEKEYEEGDCAHDLLMDEYDGDIENPRIKADHDAAIKEIYERAIEGYIESLKQL